MCTSCRKSNCLRKKEKKEEKKRGREKKKAVGGLGIKR
jgi:hypothetical protein